MLNQKVVDSISDISICIFLSFKRILTIYNSSLSSIVFKKIISFCLMMVSKPELKSVPVTYFFSFAFCSLAIIHLYSHIISPVLLFSRYALCDREKHSSTFGFILTNTIFDNICLITSSKMTGLQFATGPFVLPGFCSGTRSPKSVFVSSLLLIELFRILVIFLMEFFRTVINHFSCYFIISWCSVVTEFHNSDLVSSSSVISYSS